MSKELEEFRKDPQRYLRKRHEAPIPPPNISDLKRSKLYFGELTDALQHYSSPFEPGQFHTFTVRTGKHGKAVPEMVSATRFPPLDDLPDHFTRLHYAARQLDTLPVSFWRTLDDAGRESGVALPRFPMQITLWGGGNQDQVQFTIQANMYDLLLRDFDWSTSKDPDSYRDHAEQCFRIMDAYVQINEHSGDFLRHGMPVTEGF